MPILASATTPQNDASFLKSSYQPSPQTRHARLQQLTTQLLWRLQQSSPFHSSSNAQLVLPVLPEATPRLGVPERPAKLLPGLEESQGALYELGVADNGTLIGLAEDELEESLNNLRAMAASLGCLCDVLLKIPVGRCEWEELLNDDEPVRLHQGDLFVSEVLVRPDSRAGSELPGSYHSDQQVHQPLTTNDHIAQAVHSTGPQLRIAFLGASTAGKSSLVGTLTTSVLDNGRGKSRLSMLKHRHEIASGITSSVAHELIGYRSDASAGDVLVNYAAGDVCSWTDVHNLADELCFLVDSPGDPKYAKSVFRCLVSWKPHWVTFCIAADEISIPNPSTLSQSGQSQVSELQTTEVSMTLLGLILKLGLPVIVVITKMDLATRNGLRVVLGKVLSALKMAGRQPFVLSTPSTPVPAFSLDSRQSLPDLQHISILEQQEIDQVLREIGDNPLGKVVPIIMSSAVSGSGIGKFHSLLRGLKFQKKEAADSERTQTMQSSLFYVDEVFSIPPSKVYSSEATSRLESQGIVLCGRLDRGKVLVGQQLQLGPISMSDTPGPRFASRSKSSSLHDTIKASKMISISAAKSLDEMSESSSPRTGSNRSVFATVRVVSIRNLRLPVLSMREDETGTIGVELVHDANQTVSLDKVRKGAILRQAPDFACACHAFTATFAATDFANSSTSLLLGGHAIAYINSLRAAVKVTALALAEPDVDLSPAMDVFSFDEDDDDEGFAAGSKISDDRYAEKDVHITFRFGSTFEWMEIGDQILVVPTTSSTGPVAGPVGATSGLAGFVGRVKEVHV
jgi:GTPase